MKICSTQKIHVSLGLRPRATWIFWVEQIFMSPSKLGNKCITSNYGYRYQVSVINIAIDIVTSKYGYLFHTSTLLPWLQIQKTEVAASPHGLQQSRICPIEEIYGDEVEFGVFIVKTASTCSKTTSIVAAIVLKTKQSADGYIRVGHLPKWTIVRTVRVAHRFTTWAPARGRIPTCHLSSTSLGRAR